MERSTDKLLVARLIPALSFLICRLSMQLGRVHSRVTRNNKSNRPPLGRGSLPLPLPLPVLCRIVLWFPIFRLYRWHFSIWWCAATTATMWAVMVRSCPYFPRFPTAFLFLFAFLMATGVGQGNFIFILMTVCLMHVPTSVCLAPSLARSFAA